MATRGLGRAVFRAGAFVVLIAAPVGGFASQPPDSRAVDHAPTGTARAQAACDASSAPFQRLFPPVSRPVRARAERACAALAHATSDGAATVPTDITPVVRGASDAATALLREERDLSWHMLAVLAVCMLAAFLAVAGVGIGGALYGVAAVVVACWGGLHVWPGLVAVGTTLLSFPCTASRDLPAIDRVPAPGPTALLTAGVGTLWSLPVLAFLAGRLHLAIGTAGAGHAHWVLFSELASGAALVLVVLPAVVHFFRSRTPTGRGRAAKLGLTLAVVVAVVAGAVLAYALAGRA